MSASCPGRSAMSPSRQKARLVDSLYSIPESGDYQPFLDELRVISGSSVVNGILTEPGVPGGYVTSASGLDPSDYERREAAYFEEHGGYNPMMAAVQHVLQAGRVLRASDFAPFEVLRDSAYFRDFMHPLDADYTAGIVVESGPQGTSWLSLSRPLGAADYARSDMALLGEISAPLQRVCRLLTAIPGTGCSWELLDAGGVVAAIIDADLRCRRTTAAMDDLLSDDLLFSRSGGVLCGKERAADAGLGRLRQAAMASPGTGALDKAPEITVHDALGRRWCMTALTDVVGLAPGEMLLLIRAGAPSPAPEQSLIRKFGLTVTEARCALTFPEAPTGRALAAAMGLSRNTVKTHLRSVFRKTGTASGVDLLALLAREGLIGS